MRQQAHGIREGEVRVVAAQHRARRLGLVTCRENHRRGARLAKQRLVSWVGQEREVAGLGLLDTGDADDVDVLSAALEPAVQPFSNVTKLQ